MVVSWFLSCYCDKHHGHGSFVKKGFIWDYDPRGMRVPYGGRCGSKWQVRLQEQGPRAHILNYQLETEHELEMAQVLKLSKATFGDTLPLKPHLLKPPNSNIN